MAKRGRRPVPAATLAGPEGRIAILPDGRLAALDPGVVGEAGNALLDSLTPESRLFVDRFRLLLAHNAEVDRRERQAAGRRAVARGADSRILERMASMAMAGAKEQEIAEAVHASTRTVARLKDAARKAGLLPRAGQRTTR